jgi:hypothetical protein
VSAGFGPSSKVKETVWPPLRVESTMLVSERGASALLVPIILGNNAGGAAR